MRTIVGSIAAAGALALSGPCSAASVERDSEFDALILIGGGEDDEGAIETAVGRISLRFSGNVLFDNLIELGGGLELAGERDHPRRTPRGGAIGACPAEAPGCPPAVRGFVSGLSQSPDAREEGARASIEAAYIYVRGGWGEASIGREAGVAARYSLPLPTLIKGAGVIDPSIQPLGPGAVFVRNDLSGRSFKVSAVTQRILGASVGVSFTPEAEHEGLDQGYKERGAVPVFEPENAIEGGVSYLHTLRDGLEVGLGLTAARADAATRPDLFDAMTSYGASATLRRGGWSAGAGWLCNDNGSRASAQPYEAWAGSVAYAAGRWRSALEAGRADDDLVESEVRSVAAGVARSLTEGVEIAIQAKHRIRSAPQRDGLTTHEEEVEARGLFFSISIRR